MPTPTHSGVQRVANLRAMPTGSVSASELGTSWFVSEQWKAEGTGLFGLRTQLVALPPITFLDWTIDGKPLRDRLGGDGGTPCREVSYLAEHTKGDLFALKSLKALVGEFEAEFDPDVRLRDGRVAAPYCPLCWEVDCGAVTVDLVMGERFVDWNSVAIQDGITGDLCARDADLFSVCFRRQEYESVVRSLITEWETKLGERSTK